VEVERELRPRLPEDRLGEDTIPRLDRELPREAERLEEDPRL
jgi:hypothetical protein